MTATLAVKNANKVKLGAIDEFQVRMSDPGDLAAQQMLALLGSSSRYAYFYDMKRSEALVIPVENVSFMRKIISKKTEVKDVNKASEKKRKFRRINDYGL